MSVTSMQRSTGVRVRRAALGVALGIPLAVYAVISLLPLLWMVSGSLKDPREIVQSSALLPANPTFDAYVEVWTRLDFLQYFANSTLVTAVSIVLALAVYSMAGYAFAVLRFPGRELLFYGFLALLFVPGVTVMLPQILLNKSLGILGTHWGLILPFVNGTAPLAVLLLRNFFAEVPSQLRDAANIDGAGEWRIFQSIYLPLAKPALVTIAILTFVGVWGEYVFSAVALNRPETFTLPVGLQYLQTGTVVEWNEVMAGAVILVIPVLIVFGALQRYFIGGLAGSVKG